MVRCLFIKKIEKQEKLFCYKSELNTQFLSPTDFTGPYPLLAVPDFRKLLITTNPKHLSKVVLNIAYLAVDNL